MCFKQLFFAWNKLFFSFLLIIDFCHCIGTKFWLILPPLLLNQQSQITLSFHFLQFEARYLSLSLSFCFCLLHIPATLSFPWVFVAEVWIMLTPNVLAVLMGVGNISNFFLCCLTVRTHIYVCLFTTAPVVPNHSKTDIAQVTCNYGFILFVMPV